MRKPNLYKIYYLLAFLNMLIICLALLVGYKIYKTYDESFRTNEAWIQRSMKYDALASLAIEANSPGNIVFESRDVAKEKVAFEKTNTRISELLLTIKEDAKQNLSNTDIAIRLQKFEAHIVKANHFTKIIFSFISNNNLPEASHYMAKMDKQFHLGLIELATLREVVRDIQQYQLLEDHQKAKDIFYKEFIIAFVVLVIVGIIILYGNKIKNSFEELIDELEQKSKALEENQKKLTKVLDTMLEAVILIDSKGVVTYANPAVSNVFQYQIDELIGQNVSVLATEPHKSNHDKYIKNYLETGEKKVIGISWEAEGQRKDGTIIPLQISVTDITLNNNQYFVGVTKDITEKKKSENYIKSISKIQELYISGAKERNIFDAILDFILEHTDSEYGFIGAIYSNAQGNKYLKTYAITNIAWNDETLKFYEENAPSGLEFSNLNTLFGHTIRTGEVVIANDPKNDSRASGLPDGHPAMNSYLGMPIYGNEGLIAMFGIANRKGGYNQEVVKELNAISTVMTSIIESIRNMSVIDNMAKKDALSGVYNRFYFKTYVNELLRRYVHAKQENKFCIMMMDFNKFKNINDFYGHEAGDYIIKEFCQRIKKNIKNHDLFSRVGGDEFVILIEDISSFNDGGKVAQRVIDIANMPYMYKGKKLQCGVAVGIACYPESGKDIDALMRHADLALYKAKKEPKSYAYFSDELQLEYIKRQQMERDIIVAFEKEEFYLVFQPKVSVSNGQIVGAEALFRWPNTKNSNDSPLQYINAIESMGLSARLNLYVIDKIIELLSNYQINSPLSLSINLSPYVYHLEENIEQCITKLSSSGLNKKFNLYFELTETSFMEKEVNFKTGSRIDKLLKAHQIGLSLDDFGIKYSSINRLFECDFSIIKIDMSFVRKLDSHDANSAKVIIKAVLDIARGLNMKVVAEGAETENQVKTLQSLGCDVIQGYFYYRPMTIEKLFDVIKENNN